MNLFYFDELYEVSGFDLFIVDVNWSFEFLLLCCCVLYSFCVVMFCGELIFDLDVIEKVIFDFNMWKMMG